MVQDNLVQDLCRHIRYLLTLKARPPFRLAGLEMVAHLTDIQHCLEHLIAHHATPTLLSLQQALQPILHSLQATYCLLAEAASWLKNIAALLDPAVKPARSGQQVCQELLAFLRHVQDMHSADPFLHKTCDAILKTTHKYAPAYFTVTISPICPAPIMTAKANSVTSIAVSCEPPDKNDSRVASSNARRLGTDPPS